MTACPVGHDSAAADFCDVCGRPIGAAAPPEAAGTDAAEATSWPDDKCPVCQRERTGQFCEGCGRDFEAVEEAEAPAAAWTAVIRADRQYFDSMTEANGQETTEFPASLPERQFRLTGAQVQIGRRSPGGEPDIDLSGPPADTGVSRQHAVLLAEAGGTWALLDQGSANGTQLNGVEVAPNQRAPLHDGDEISIGRWTVLTIRTLTTGQPGSDG
jgi:pSer/pThr/pTyr-binding forkhead associated (FHA) protein